MASVVVSLTCAVDYKFIISVYNFKKPCIANP